jgi:hypothetical protein
MCDFLDGRRILLVGKSAEVEQLARWVEIHNGEALAVVPVPGEAVTIRIEEIGGAVVDTLLEDSLWFPIADQLMAGGIPTILITSDQPDFFPDRFKGLPQIARPVTAPMLELALRGVFREM